jgi:capsular polysaccharide transport system permease protein
MSLPLPPLPRARPARPRTAWEIQRGVVFALVMREMKARVGGQWLGAVWTLFEPLAHIFLMITVFSYIGRSAPMRGIEYPVFLVTGLLPYFLFMHLATRLMDGIDANKGLYAYRQVKPLDALLGRAIVEVILNLVVYVFTLMILAWAGYHVVPDGLLGLVGAQALLMMLGLSFGIFIATVGHGRPRLRSFVRISMFPLYLASGVIFPIHTAPRDILPYLLLNPLAHLIDLSRHAFIPQYTAIPGVTVTVPVLWTVGLGALAMLNYRAKRHTLVTST